MLRRGGEDAFDGGYEWEDGLMVEDAPVKRPQKTG